MAGAAEGYDLYRALEAVPQPGFTLGCLTVHQFGRLVAAAPMFEMVYRLDTPFQGKLRAITDRIHAHLPRLTSVSVLGLGSPMSDNCSIGFARDLDPAARAGALATMLDHLATEAKRRRSTVIALKSLGPEATQLHATATRAGFGRVTSVPVVMLPLPFASLDAYLASLPDKTSSYLKRKLRGAKDIRIEYRRSTAGIEGRLMQLYRSTLAQSSVDYGDLDDLHPGYFTELLSRLGDRAQLMLCWKGEQLLSFQVFIVGDKRIIANKIGMQYPEARDHNLYFVNWLKMIEFAIERGIPEIEMGATTYAAKLMFGGHLERRWLYFRFRNGIANRLVRPAHPYFDFERNDPGLKELHAKGLAESIR